MNGGIRGAYYDNRALNNRCGGARLTGVPRIEGGTGRGFRLV